MFSLSQSKSRVIQEPQNEHIVIMSNIHGELQLKRLIFELRFHPSLRYYDEMNEIGDRLNQTYPHWQRNWTKIQFTDRANRSSLLIEHNRIGSHMDVPEQFGDFKRRALDGVKTYNERVQISRVRRAGVRALWLCPVDFGFGELLGIIQDKFYAPKEALSEVIGSQFTDVAYVFYFEKDGYNIHLQIGPVRKEEIPRWIPPRGPVDEEPEGPENVELHDALDEDISSQAARSQKSDDGMTNLTYPEVAVFYDVDCYTEELKIKDMEIFLDRGYSTAKSVAIGITKYLMEA